MSRLAIATLVLMIVTCGGARTAEPCTCLFDGRPACESYREHDVAFIAHVVEAGPRGGDLRERIDRALKGVTPGDVLVRNDDASVGCG
jgi:hypothetical protein